MIMATTNDEQTVNATITKGTNEQINAIAHEFKMHKKYVFGRILDWFVQQDQMLQSTVLGRIPEDYMSDVTAAMFARHHPEEWARVQAETKELGAAAERTAGEPPRPKQKRKRGR